MPAARILLWVTSIGGVALLVRSVLIGPVPLHLAALLLLLYFVMTAVGWVFPQLQMYGDVLCAGRRGRQRVALTFDDGPHPETTRQVLALLAQRKVTATFFVLGQKAAAHPDVIREIHEAGHTLGLHGYVHRRLYAFQPPARVAADIAATAQVIQDACGVRPTIFRPPLGHVSPRVAAGAKRAGVRLVAWNVMGLDGVPISQPDAVARRVGRGLRDGAIVLLHDAAERDDRQPAALAALPIILEQIENRGLEPVSVEQFLEE